MEKEKKILLMQKGPFCTAARCSAGATFDASRAGAALTLRGRDAELNALRASFGADSATKFGDHLLRLVEDVRRERGELQCEDPAFSMQVDSTPYEEFIEHVGALASWYIASGEAGWTVQPEKRR